MKGEAFGPGLFGSRAVSLTAISDEGTEVQSHVWGCAASVAETEREKAREDLEKKISADASWNPGLTT